MRVKIFGGKGLFRTGRLLFEARRDGNGKTCEKGGGEFAHPLSLLSSVLHYCARAGNEKKGEWIEG